MKIIVTGGAGFIGTHTVKELLARGYEVTAIDIKPFDPSLTTTEHKNLNLVNCDILSSDIETFIDKGDKILHLAAVAHFVAQEKAVDAIRVNVCGTANVVFSAIKKRAERIVYSSTGSVYSKNAKVPIHEDTELGPPEYNYYGHSKLQAETWIRVFGRQLPYIILRYSYVYGSLKDWGAIGKWVYHNIPRESPPIIFGGSQRNDFVYVKDVVEANILSLESHRLNETYNIGTGRAASIRDACSMCLKAMNSNLEPKIGPARTFDFPVFYYDTEKAQNLLGFKAKWSLSDGIKDLVSTLYPKTS